MVGIQKFLNHGEDVITRYPNITFTHICMYFICHFSNDKKCATRKILTKWQKICICRKKAVPLSPFFYGDMNEFLEKEEAILKMLKTVFDPEIPVNVYDLGLIYGIEIKDDGVCEITMTLTAPSCPAGDFLVEDIRQKVGSVEGIKDVNVTIVFEPEWTKDMMSEEAKLELGFL